MPTKQPAKKNTSAKKMEAPAKGKKIKAKADRLEQPGGNEPKNATGS